MADIIGFPEPPDPPSLSNFLEQVTDHVMERIEMDTEDDVKVLVVVTNTDGSRTSVLGSHTIKSYFECNGILLEGIKALQEA